MMKHSNMQENNERPESPPKHPNIGEWIKLKSKTHLGRPFYVHTVTGASVWSRTHAELAKLKNNENKVFTKVAEPTVRPENTVQPGTTGQQENAMALRRQMNYQVQKPITQLQPDAKTKVWPATTVPPEQINEIPVRRQITFQVQNPIPQLQPAAVVTVRSERRLWSEQNNEIPLQRQIDYQVLEPIPQYKAASDVIVRPETTAHVKTTKWSEQNNEMPLRRQINYQVQEPTPQSKLDAEATLRPKTTVWSEQNYEMPLQRQINYQLKNPIPQMQPAAETAGWSETTVHPKTTVQFEKINEMPLQRQFINYQVQNPVSQMQPNASFTHTQPYAPYDEPQITIPIQPPNTLIVPPYPPPPILVPNYPPPPIQNQGSIYPTHYPQPPMNIPNSVDIKVQATSVSMSSRFKILAVGSEVKKTIVNNATPEQEITKITPVVKPLITKPFNNKPCNIIPCNIKPNHHKQFIRNSNRRHTRFLRNDGVKDLREVLRAKRFKKMTKRVSFQLPEERAYDNGDKESDIESQMTHLNVDNKANNQCEEDELLYTNSQSETRLSSDNDEMFDDEYSNRFPEHTGLKNQPMNFKQLKMEMGCSDDELWYVMADTNVFIGNCYFLKTIVNSDEKCRLLVTHRVITELDGFVKHCAGTEASQMAALSAIRFLESSSKVVTDVMLSGKLNFNVRYKNGDDQILDCALQLSKSNFRLIFLSNDVRLINRTTNSNVLTFTVPELKKILNSTNSTEKKDDITRPISITFNNSCQGSPNSVEKETLHETANKSAKIQVPRQNIADSGAQTDFSPEKIKIVIPNTKQLVNKDVQTNDDHFNDGSSNRETELMNRNANVQVATEPKRETRKERRTRWWSRRRKLETTTNIVSTSTDTADSTKSGENIQTEVQTFHNSPQKTNISHEQSNADSNDSFSLSKRFSGSHLISDSSQLHPRTVEESPTNSSDAISNTRSSVCSVNNVVSDRTNDIGNLERHFAGVIDSNLFNATDREMEERLRTGAEEWTSRFLQIMEEALSQLLRQNPLPNNPHQPPWTVHEATVCLKEKYNNNSAIVNAATLFTFTIFACSDKMGNIYRTLSPERFMKLFCHGWSLIFVLHQVLSGRPGSDDLVVAKDSLTKLLSDIKGLNSDAIDNFVDISAEECLKQVNMNSHQSDDMGGQGDMFQHYDSPQTRSPILQNPKKDPMLTQASAPSAASSDYVKIIRNININDAELIQSINNYNATDRFDEDEFSESLHKIASPDHSPPPEPSKIAEGISFSPKTPEASPPPTNGNPTIIRKFTTFAEFEKRLKNGSNSNKIMHSSTTRSPTKTNPKIISNLKKFAEFEERLKRDNDKLDQDIGIEASMGLITRANVIKDMDIGTKESMGQNTRMACPNPANVYLDMDMLSYSDDEDYAQFDAYNDDDGCVDGGDDDLLEEIVDNIVGEKPVKDPEVMIKTFLAEIKDSFLQVRSYCEQTYFELSNGKVVNSERRAELKEQTEDMHTFLNSLLSTLNSILMRENTSEVNIQKSRFAYFKICATQCSTYSDIIEKCSAQAKILLDVLNSIMRDIVA